MKNYEFRPRWLAHIVNAVLVGKMYPEEKHPISRILFKVYGPPVHFVLKHPRIVIAIALMIVLITIPAYFTLGHEFMPPLNEGVILYMPTTLPGISITAAGDLLQKQDALLRPGPAVDASRTRPSGSAAASALRASARALAIAVGGMARGLASRSARFVEKSP